MQIELKYQVPFTESIQENDFIIQGTAINETITSNNHKFIAEELQPAAQTLTGVPLLVDHENKVENIKGRVLQGFYNEIGKKVEFKAKVMDELCKQMIKDGRLNSVSVGASVRDVEEVDGALVPRGIQFKELSLVAVPADSNATFNIALKEAYNASKPVIVEVVEPVKEIVKEVEKVDFEDKLTQQVNPANATEVVKEVQGEVEELRVLKGGLNEMSEEQKTVVASADNTKMLLEKLEAMEKKLTEMSMPKVEEKPVLKNEFEESDADVTAGYKIIQGNGYFTLVNAKY